MDKRYGDRTSPRGDLVFRGAAPPAPCALRAAEVRRAIARARAWIVGKRAADGGWEDDAPILPSLVARFILARRFSESFLEDEIDSTVGVLLAAQLSDGGWADAGSQADLNTSVEVYLALKIGRRGSLDTPLRRALRRIRELGGADACTGETRLLLALFGQASYARIRPSLNPNSTLGLLRQLETAVCLRPQEGISELFLREPERWDKTSAEETRPLRAWKWPAWRFRRGQAVSKAALRDVLKSLNRSHDAALGTAELFRIAFLLVAIDRGSGPAWRRCWRRLSLLAVDDEAPGRFHFRRNLSMIGSTAAALGALREAGLDTRHPTVARAVGRLVFTASRWEPLESETRLAVLSALGSRFGVSSDALPPTAFLVEEEDAESADSPDSAELSRRITCFVEEQFARLRDTAEPEAFDAALCGTALETLGTLGMRAGVRLVDRLVRRLARLQRADGSFDDPKVGPICATAAVILGFTAVEVSTESPVVARALHWLRLWQDDCGGWRGAEDNGPDGFALEIAPTAAALEALLSRATECDYDLIHRGVGFLLEAQNGEGAWGKTVDGSAEMHATLSALVALSRYAVAAADLPAAVTRPTLRVVRAEEETAAPFPLAR